jgi:hypothetical protein
MFRDTPRDSLFGETIQWIGRPRVTSVPPLARLIGVACAAVAVITLLFAVVVATSLHVPVGGLILFAAWCSALGLLAWRWPQFWRSGVQYIITDRHVIWRRGPIRRSIERDAVSYARIRWNPKIPGVGDLVLVRAVPTGALRRTLSLTLSDVVGPDRLWAIVRGVAPSPSLGDGDRPLAQRLDEGERVLWTGIPMAAPWTLRRLISAGLSCAVAVAAARIVVHAAPALRRMSHTHALPGWSFTLFAAALGISVLFVGAVAGGVGYMAWLRPHQLARMTRYLVTNQRVLIRRGREELSLDRGHIADVISAPTRGGLGDALTRAHGATALIDMFLVLDGPHARAFASSGAFGEGEGDMLVPVLSAIEDAETVGAILRPEVVHQPLAA